MSIKCGRCSLYHESVDDVRACFNGQNVASEKPERAAGDSLTSKQVGMVSILLKKLGLVWTGPTPIESLDKWVEGRTLIDQLKQAELDKAHGKPWDAPEGTKVSARPTGNDSAERSPSRPHPRLPDVPAGFYATPSATGNNDYDFWSVDRPTEGRWAGRTFVDRVIGGRSNTPVRGATARQALEAINSEGIEVARIRFAQELGRCWKCGRHLTDDESRRLGIGPVCRAA